VNTAQLEAVVDKSSGHRNPYAADSSYHAHIALMEITAMDWQDILLSFVLNGVIALILKSSIEAAFTKEITDLQHTHSKELAQLNAELRRLNTIEATKFTELHQRRATAILDLYKLLASAERDLSLAVIPIPKFVGDETQDKDPYQKVIEATNPVRKAVTSVTEFYSGNKVLLSKKQEQLMSEIADVFKSLESGVFMRVLYREQPPKDEELAETSRELLNERMEEANRRFKEIYPTLKEDLEDDFRHTLGLETID
jgi:hypothetical protein